jgi:F0F1-type ATP synthase membrane subunit c/vacuolar-type H+-ATPase subunit K
MSPLAAGSALALAAVGSGLGMIWDISELTGADTHQPEIKSGNSPPIHELQI